MSQPPAPIHPDEAKLDRLAELDLALAERLQARAMAAEDAGEISILARTYQGQARSLRQTLALKAQLERQRELAVRETPPAPKPREPAAVRNRRYDIRAAVLRVVWSEQALVFDPGVLTDELEALMDAMVAAGGFVDADLDEQIADLCVLLDLSPELSANWANLPQFYDEDGSETRALEEDIARRSSA